MSLVAGWLVSLPRTFLKTEWCFFSNCYCDKEISRGWTFGKISKLIHLIAIGCFCCCTSTSVQFGVVICMTLHDRFFCCWNYFLHAVWSSMLWWSYTSAQWSLALALSSKPVLVAWRDLQWLSLNFLHTTIQGYQPLGKPGKVSEFDIVREKSRKLGKVRAIMVCMGCATTVVIVAQ